MYWYLSFLRPPPVSVPCAAGSITITPQVANDLRTETRFEPTEIYYVWQQTYPTSASPLPAEHLTTYTPPSSTYRALAVPLPSTAKPGQKWRLGLCTPRNSEVTEAGPSRTALWQLCEADPPVLGVWSEPIDIVTGAEGSVARSKANGASAKSKQADDQRPTKRQKGKEKEQPDVQKQTRIQREWDLGQERTLKVVEQTSFDLDKKIWDSGLALSSWIWRRRSNRHDMQLERSLAVAENIPHPLIQEVMDLLEGTRDQHRHRIIELGSGTGLVSVVLRTMLGHTPLSSDCEIIATDLHSALKLMRENIDLIEEQPRDGRVEPSERERLSACELDWDAPLPGWASERGCDIIVAADVTYNTAVFPAFIKTVAALMQNANASGRHPPLLLAYKQRDPGERELWTMLEEEHIEMVLLDKVQGAEAEGAVEVWLGRFAS